MSTRDELRRHLTDEGRGLPLVFVHGFPFSRACWRPQIDALSSSVRTIAADLPGFGGRGGRAETVTMGQFADDIAGLLEVLGTGPAVLIGHSMGGYVALAFADRHPAMLQGLVLVGTRAGQDTLEAASHRRATAEKVRENGTAKLIDAMAPKMLAPGNRSADSVEAVRGLMATATREGVIGALLGMAARPDAGPILNRISVPTLVVTGAEDEVIPPAESESMAQAIPDARLRVLPAAGHLVAWEQPGPFSRELLDWLDAKTGRTSP